MNPSNKVPLSPKNIFYLNLNIKRNQTYKYCKYKKVNSY